MAVEVTPVSHESRRQALETAKLVHPRPEAVTASLFVTGGPFFLAADKVQVKYEMLRAHVVEHRSVTAASKEHGYSRAEFYLVAAAFEETGMGGLLDERRGRKGPVKLTAEVTDFLASLEPCSASEAAVALENRMGVRLHPRSIQRLRRQ